MKKSVIIVATMLFVAAFVSCKKENSVDSLSAVTVNVFTETPVDSQTKVSLVESGSNFSLNWENSDSFVVCNSSNTNGGKVNNTFTVTSKNGTSAVFTGSLPDVEGTTTNYMAAFNFVSSTDAGYCRADLPSNQDYSPDGVLASNCLLVARNDDATVGTLGNLSFKTMNAFMKFSLKKGSAAEGSSNSYTKMYVQSIKVETVADGEAIAGRFGFLKSGDWGSAYDETVAAQKKSSVILNCVTASFVDGVELDPSTATDFYVAIALGSYSKGLRVTVSVKNEAGKFGVYSRTISNNTNYNVARNTLVSMPALVVNPDDDNVDTYTLIDKIADLSAGDYIMCAVKSGYQAFKGSISSNNLVTETVTYNTTTKVLTFTNATTVTLIAAGENQYKISWPYNSSTDYLKTTSSQKLAYDTSVTNAAVWSVSNVSTGILFTEVEGNGTYMRTATTASSNYIRGYNSTGTVGLVFFSKD